MPESQEALEARVQAEFERQALMRTLGAEIVTVSVGEVRIEMPYSQTFSQQDGFLHAGVVTSLADSACGFAAFSRMRRGDRVLSVEFKVDLMRPAVGDRFAAIGKVIKAGATLTVCTAEVMAITDLRETTIALMQATMIALRPRP